MIHTATSTFLGIFFATIVGFGFLCWYVWFPQHMRDSIVKKTRNANRLKGQQARQEADEDSAEVASPPDPMTALEAVGYAAMMHAGQVDKNGVPYIAHCVRVMLRLPADATDDEKVAALLHHSNKDAQALIEAGVSPGAASLVQALIRAKVESYECFIERIVRHGSSAVRIKLADIEDNSDPEQIQMLDEATAKGIAQRYDAARSILKGG